MVNNFTIRQQQNKRRGCIPACALSILDFLGVTLPLTEASLVAGMWTVPGNPSGFERLRSTMGALGADVLIGTVNLQRALRYFDSVGVPLLVAKKGSPAHCVVALGLVDGQVVQADPDNGAITHVPFADFLGACCGDYAVIVY
ncbi:MAG: hypothetical protein AAB393_13755 [Bacteroidota bacterium]